MFRTFSCAFLSHEEHYFHVRSHIVRTIELDQKVFSEYLNKPTIKGGWSIFFCWNVKNFFASLCSFICLQAVYQLSGPED